MGGGRLDGGRGVAVGWSGPDVGIGLSANLQWAGRVSPFSPWTPVRQPEQHIFTSYSEDASHVQGRTLLSGHLPFRRLQWIAFKRLYLAGSGLQRCVVDCNGLQQRIAVGCSGLQWVAVGAGGIGGTGVEVSVCSQS